MSLTLADGPLAPEPPETTNYCLAGPDERLMLAAFPRRVRAILGGVTVLDTERGQLLHRTGRLPQLYVPADDVETGLLHDEAPSDRDAATGDAVHWTMRAHGREAPGAVWEHRDPPAGAAWLTGLLGVDFTAMDTWLDEDEEVRGHLRDPFHRVDARHSRRTATAAIDGRTVARSDRPVVLSETGMPNRIYFPPEDVDLDALRPSDTRTICPYKGEATYFTRRDGGGGDVAFCYPEPLSDAAKVESYLSFDGDGVEGTLDGRAF